MNLRQFRRVRQFILRAFPALVLTLISCSASFSQHITCPVTGEYVNSGNAFNSQNPCVIQAGATFINQINANFFNTPGAALVNSSGATLTLQDNSLVENDGTFTNNGRINDAGLLLNGATVAGGTLNTNGAISILSNGTLQNGTSVSVATLNVGFEGTLSIFGQLTNIDNAINSAGTIVNAGGTLTNEEGTIINFGGTIDNAGAFNNNGTLYNGGTVTNFAGSTFKNGLLNNIGTFTNFGNFDSGDGNVVNSGKLENEGNLSSVSATNNSGGTILNDAGATLFSGKLANNSGATIVNAAGATWNNGGPLTNAGTITNGGTFANSGTLDIQAGSVFNNLAGSTYVQNAEGQTIVDGTMNSASTVQIVLGVLSGTGTINGNVSNTFGTVQPGDELGTLEINGDYTQAPRGTLSIELDGTANGQFGVLDVSGLATLDGAVDFTVMNGFIPVAGDDFVFLLFGSNSGNFSTIDFTNWTCPVNDTCTDVVGANSMSLEINGPTTPSPEPSPLFLLGMGLAALGVCYRWKKAAAIA